MLQSQYNIAAEAARPLGRLGTPKELVVHFEACSMLIFKLVGEVQPMSGGWLPLHCGTPAVLWHVGVLQSMPARRSNSETPSAKGFGGVHWRI